MIAAQQDLTSIHSLSAELQVPSKTIERTAVALAMAPALRLNQLVYFDAEQAEQLADAIRQQLNK